MATQLQKMDLLQEKKDMLMILPEEVVMKILVTLPVKSLLCLRCVSKSLNSFLKNPYFINLHMKQQCECILMSDKNQSFLSFHSYESLNKVAPHLEIPHFNSNAFNITWPCNGLLVCVDAHASTRTIVLCNPATREFKLLPSSPFHVRYVLDISVGLGFDSSKNDYKVVTISNRNSDYKFEVYNLSSNSWRQIDHDMPPIYVANGVQSNGALHWIAQRESVDIIVSFNVSTEVFQNMDLPDSIAPHCIVKNITIVNDSLALFAFSPIYHLAPKFLDIWVRKEGSWAKQINIHGNMFNGYIYPCLMWKNEAILMYIDSFNLKVFTLDTQTISDTEIMSSRYASQSVRGYKESLVSIK